MCLNYTTVSAAWRHVSAAKQGKPPPPAPRSGCCAALIQTTGHKDLDEYNADPRPLRFEFELVAAQAPDDYDRESWALTKEEKVARLPDIRADGKILFGIKDYMGALVKYETGLQFCEDILRLEQKGSPKWTSISVQMKLPFLINCAQCLNSAEEYAEAADRCSQALEIDSHHIKAHYVRGTALTGCWRLSEAKKCFERAAQLDPTLAIPVSRKLAELKRLAKEKRESDRLQYQRMFQS